MYKKACLVFLIAILIPSFSFAEIKTIYATHKYQMGDNDSKNDARRMCFLEAKRKALEKAGTYIRSHTEIKNLQLTKDEISIYSAALLKVETISEKWKLEGSNMTVILTVKADVDSKTVDEQLSKLTKDTSAQKKIKDQQRRLNKLEREVTELQKQLGSVEASEAATLRKERNVTFKQIDKIEAKKIAILNSIEAKTKDALKYVESGMTITEVYSLLGPPRTTEDRFVGIFQESSASWSCMNYGNVWVIARNAIVKCIVYSKCYNACTTCGNSIWRSCIAK